MLFESLRVPELFHNGGYVFIALASREALLKSAEGCDGGGKLDRKLAAFLNRIAQVFGHEAQQEIRRVVLRHHSAGNGFDERTARRTRDENLKGLGTVKAAALDHGDGLRAEFPVAPADEVVDELQQRTAADGPKRSNGLAHGAKHGPSLFKSGRCSANEEIKLP